MTNERYHFRCLQKQSYTDAGQTAILSLQSHGARLVRMQRDGKRPAFKWGGRTGRCLTQHQVKSWLRINGRFALVPFPLDSVSWISTTGPWRDLASVYPPHAVIPSKRSWRRHLYILTLSHALMPKSASSTAVAWMYVQRRDTWPCGTLKLFLEAAENPRQGVLFPSALFWPEKGAQGPPQPPVKPPPPSVEEPRDGPLNDAYPGSRWFRLLAVVKGWAYDHAREYSKRDGSTPRFGSTPRKGALKCPTYRLLGRTQQLPR